MALMSRLDVMQHALDEQRKDERRKESLILDGDVFLATSGTPKTEDEIFLE